MMALFQAEERDSHLVREDAGNKERRLDTVSEGSTWSGSISADDLLMIWEKKKDRKGLESRRPFEVEHVPFA